MANGKRGETERAAQAARIELIAEGPAGLVYHDRAAGEWSLDLLPRGALLSFTAEEFRSLLILARAALRHPEVRALLGGRGAGPDGRVTSGWAA